MGITHTAVATVTDIPDYEVGTGEWNAAHDLSASELLDFLTAETDTTLRLAPDGAGGAEWVAGAVVSAAVVSALGFVGAILISDTPSTPLVFADLVQNEATDDLVYADPV